MERKTSDEPISDDTSRLYLERLDPNERNDHEAAQHWARYEWACQLLPARRVLDCSCGVGYGTALLRARGAESVVGVDISGDAIAHAKRSYGGAGIEYMQADATTLRPKDIGMFDLIVSLETIEHLAEPEKLLDVFGSLLGPGGVLVLSCPNDAYLGVENPYHLWRADFAKLESWLANRFAHVTCYGEVHTFGAAVWPIADMASRPKPAKRYTLTVRLVDTVQTASSAGFVFACGDRPPPVVAPVAAELLDGHGYLRELEHVRERLWNEAQQFRNEAERLAEAWEAQNAHIAEREQDKNRLWAEAQRLSQAWETQNARIQELESVKDKLWTELKAQEAELGRSQQELARLREEIAETQQRRGHRFLCRLGLLNRIDV